MKKRYSEENEKMTKGKREKRLKISKQTAMTLAMIGVSTFVISVATYAWFLISNTPKIVSAEFTADTIGNLQISNVKDDNGTDKPEAYKTSINLFDGVSDDDRAKLYLSPVTTEDGFSFYKPIYGSDGTVQKLEALKEDTTDEKKELNTKYVYEKKFFLRAGASGADSSSKAKTYNIYLAGQTTDEAAKSNPTFDENYGSFLLNSAGGSKTAANAVRVSFKFKDTVTGETAIYEPNFDKHNGGITGEGGNMSDYANPEGKNYGKYTTIQQYSNKSFDISGSDGTKEKSKAICSIKEGKDIEVTMRIWIEGMDEDCDNDIAANKMKGQIQFVSKEK